MKRIRYLLGLSSPAEREHIESEYFEDEDAFEKMLTAEDDLIDAYARGELTGEERRGFERIYVSSLHGRDRVHFARAFDNAVSASRSVETKRPGRLPFQWIGPLRTATIAAVIVFVAVLAWLVNDRRKLTNELRELRAESAELRKRTEALQQSSDTERTRTAEIAAQFPDLRAEPDKPRHREPRTIATQRARHIPEVKNVRESIAIVRRKKSGVITQTAALGNVITISELPIQGRGVATLLTLQPTIKPVEASPQNLSNHGETSVRGTVKDPSGNVVSGATVTLTDPARNFTRTQSTNKDGTYVFNSIQPGTYSMEVMASGFKAASVSGLAALVNTPTVCDVPLEIGAVSETVAVSAAAEAAINRSDATLGNTFEPKRITELPLDARNVASLLSLEPGVSRTGFVNGGRADQSNITLDGVDINEVDAAIHIPSFSKWIRFKLTLKTAAIHEDYRVTITTADARPVTSVDWSEPLTPNQTIIDTPAISTDDLASGDYVLLLMGKEPDGSFVKVAEFSFKVIKP